MVQPKRWLKYVAQKLMGFPGLEKNTHILRDAWHQSKCRN
jgi:hypothetical protein